MPLTRGFSFATGTIICAAMLVLLRPAAAPALINADYTPIHLFHQSSLVFELELERGEDGRWSVREAEVIEGEAEASDDRPTGFDLDALEEWDRQSVQETLGTWERERALLFVGNFGRAFPPGLLHVRGLWLRVDRAEGDEPWPVRTSDPDLQAVWNGGTGQLARAVDYIQTHPLPDLPARAGVRWGEPVEVTDIASPVVGAQAVDLTGDARLALVLLSGNGEGRDRVFQWDEDQQTMADVTGDLGLRSRSRAAAWGDFTGNDRLDLVSAGEAGLTLWEQAEDGAFAASETALPVDEATPVLDLATVAVDGASGVRGLLVSTEGRPILLTPAGEGDFEASRLGSTDSDAELGKAHACLVADFTGDGVVDVLQPFAEGAQLYEGTAPGAFEEPRTLEGLSLGDEPARGVVGDFDQDGQFDVYFAGAGGSYYWQNAGEGRFRERLNLAGEVSYHTRDDAVAPLLCDLNADGRQDVTLLYQGQGPQYFFNRGFRSFGFAIDFDPMDTLPALGQGQQAGAVGDFTGDGAQELAMVLNDGTLWLMRRDVEDAPGLAVRVAVPPAGGAGAPVRVTAEYDERPLGAWNVTPGAGEAYFGVPTAGPVRLRWQTPDGEWHEREVTPEEGAVNVTLTP